MSASLEAHSLNCCVRSRLLSHITVTTNGSSLCDQQPSHFHFFLDGVHFSMPIAYVQSSTFSFCRLHHFHDLLLSKLSCQTTSTQHDLWTLTGINVLVEEPTWLHRDRTSYVTSLSALTMSQLNDVVNSLRLTSPQRKSDLVNVVLTDFFEQRTCFWYIVINSSRPCAYSISQHFHDRYHNAVFQAFRDLRPYNLFSTNVCVSAIDPPCEGVSDLWLYQSFDVMDSRLRRSSKEEILHSLHLIPSQISIG